MNDLKYKYLIFEGTYSGEYRIVDRQRKVICNIKDGRYINDTKECLKIYIKDKGKDWENRRMGYVWIKCLITGNARETMNKVILKTNNLKEFDLKCFEIMQEQIKRREKNIKYYKEKLAKNEQYYTYAFSNLDYVIGENSLDESYFENTIEKENILERIIKPHLDSDKEQEYTIIDEVYDLGTTFYYIEEPKDDYEKFIKFMSENLIVNDIWKDNTIIVKLNEFVKEHTRELSNLFGKQTEEVHIENLIKMIDGNATESCYSDFKKQFKTDFKFTLCNGHTFDDIKNKSKSELEYEKAHDLAFVENRDIHSSAYLGVYDGKFVVTYSVHSTKDFDKIFENTIIEYIDMNTIKSEEQLKETLKSMLLKYYQGRDEVIDKLAKKLDEDINVMEQGENEELEE